MCRQSATVCLTKSPSRQHRSIGPLALRLQTLADPRSRRGRRHPFVAVLLVHRIVATCVRLGIPALADLAYLGAGGTFATPTRRPPRNELTARQRSMNRSHARLRYPVERGMATLKRWRIFRHARCSPNRLSSAAKAILTLEWQR
ncbi:transposase family protein [Actinacidiphila sp. bgisy160]|uniref:transposase family protein n=1 Tax=Actinacidiphila sp. bgisy160 TaxID=3413796 RepID=UPI003D724703